MASTVLTAYSANAARCITWGLVVNKVGCSCARRRPSISPTQPNLPLAGMYGEAGGLKTIGHIDAANIDVGRDAWGQAPLPMTAQYV